MSPDPEIFALARRVGERLRQARETVAVAESSTGGLLGGALTEVPGSSAYFLGGVIAYANPVKAAQLGVSTVVLQTDGAVSAATAAAMAEGVRRLLKADIGVSITAIAGPDVEGSKPVGLTFIGIADPLPHAHRYQWTGNRWENRRQSVLAALELLAQALEAKEVH